MRIIVYTAWLVCLLGNTKTGNTRVNLETFEALNAYAHRISYNKHQLETVENAPSNVVRKYHSFNKLRSFGPLVRSQQSGHFFDGLYESVGEFMWNNSPSYFPLREAP